MDKIFEGLAKNGDVINIKNIESYDSINIIFGDTGSVKGKFVSQNITKDAIESGKIIHLLYSDSMFIDVSFANGKMTIHDNDFENRKLRVVSVYGAKYGEDTDIQKEVDKLKAEFDSVLTGVTQDSEILDARVKADGSTAPTLGEAIRGQVITLKEDLTQLSDKVEGISEEVFIGSYVNYMYGNIRDVHTSIAQRVGNTIDITYTFSGSSDFMYCSEPNAPVFHFEESKKYFVAIGVDVLDTNTATGIMYPAIRTSSYTTVQIPKRTSIGYGVKNEELFTYAIVSGIDAIGSIILYLDGAGSGSKTLRINMRKFTICEISDDYEAELLLKSISNANDIQQYISISKMDKKIDLLRTEIENKVGIVSDLFYDRTILTGRLLNTVGWTEANVDYNTNTFGIPVESEKSYCIMHKGIPCCLQTLKAIVWKSADDITSFIQSTFISRSESTKNVWVAPSNAKYLFISVPKEFDINDYSVYEGVYPSAYKSSLVGKKVMTLGDSLTAQGVWQKYAFGKLGVSGIVNLGIGGTRPNVFADNVTAENIADIDVVTIMGFFNSNNVPVQPVGDISDVASNSSSASVIANYKYLIDTILTLKPSVNIVILTPHCPRADDSKDKADGIIEVAKLYRLPYIDVYGEGGFNSMNASEFLLDAVHSNYKGYAKESTFICGKMLSIFA